MKVKDFIKQKINIDIYDTTDDIGVPLTAPVSLTAEGAKYFADALNFNIAIEQDNGIARVKTRSLKSRMQAIEFFYATAGYCAKADYSRWFVA